MPDLTPWLQEWPWRPGRLDVRRATGADGRLLLQVRIEMGFVPTIEGSQLTLSGADNLVLVYLRDPFIAVQAAPKP